MNGSLRILRLIAALVLCDCSSGGSGGPSSDDMGSGCHGCGATQVCVQGACMAAPPHCPYAKESYCDQRTNTCVPGCIADDQCNIDRVCDTTAQKCVTG